MISINPSTGERVQEPGITPTIAAKLTGQAVSLPAAQSPGWRGNVGHRGAADATASSPGARPVGASTPDAAIVYDAQEGRYINGRRAATPPPSASRPASQTTESGLVPSAPVGAVVPTEGGEQEARPTESQGFGQATTAVGGGAARPVHAWPVSGAAPRANPNANAVPGSAGTFPVRQGPVAPSAGQVERREGTVPAGGSYSGAWAPQHITSAPAAQHTSSAPAGGGSAGASHGGGGAAGGGAPSGGGHSSPPPSSGNAGGGHH
jgi:translation initiation factor IF-2